MNFVWGVEPSVGRRRIEGGDCIVKRNDTMASTPQCNLKFYEGNGSSQVSHAQSLLPHLLRPRVRRHASSARASPSRDSQHCRAPGPWAPSEKGKEGRNLAP